MELERVRRGLMVAFCRHEDRLREGAGVQRRDHLAPPTLPARRDEQHGVTTGRAVRRRKDGEDVPVAGPAAPAAETRSEISAHERP